PGSLQSLFGGHARRVIVGLRFREQQIVGGRSASGRAFVQQIEIAFLRTGKVQAKLPTVFKDLLTGRFERVLIRFPVAHLLDRQRVVERTLWHRSRDFLFPKQRISLPNQNRGAASDRRDQNQNHSDFQPWFSSGLVCER